MTWDTQKGSVLEGKWEPLFQGNLYTWQFFVTFLGWLSVLLERLSDLQLGDKKVTLNHLVGL